MLDFLYKEKGGRCGVHSLFEKELDTTLCEHEFWESFIVYVTIAKMINYRFSKEWFPNV